jgi:chloride channel protein, CIC family
VLSIKFSLFTMDMGKLTGVSDLFNKFENTKHTELRDFTTSRRVLRISLLAVGIGIVAAFIAFALLKLIAFFTNIFFFQRLSFASASPADNHLGILIIIIPVIGGLIIGLMA